MASTFIEVELVGSVQSAPRSILRKLTLLRAHPTKFVFDIIGYMWGTYFLWHQNWPLAAALIVGMSVLGAILAWRADERRLAETALGQLLLIHLHPLNMALHVTGLIPLLAGIWLHETPYILGGLTVMGLGHLQGWNIPRRV